MSSKNLFWVHGDPVGVLSIFCLFIFYLEPPWFLNAGQSVLQIKAVLLSHVYSS